ncbi:hypothetical protein PoMZ_10343 [Pyricularia oryzae]|uniref:Uncharacterized protein n=1 Tax=Pyricularia oryzae TaxID=318829 RepID=A0A4P7N210_PYROR|nr:hypothetical protein PoMZ_10343 [Pyricularia oryzae]
MFVSFSHASSRRRQGSTSRKGGPDGVDLRVPLSGGLLGPLDALAGGGLAIEAVVDPGDDLGLAGLHGGVVAHAGVQGPLGGRVGQGGALVVKVLLGDLLVRELVGLTLDDEQRRAQLLGARGAVVPVLPVDHGRLVGRQRAKQCQVRDQAASLGQREPVQGNLAKVVGRLDLVREQAAEALQENDRGSVADGLAVGAAEGLGDETERARSGGGGDSADEPVDGLVRHALALGGPPSSQTAFGVADDDPLLAHQGSEG